jgi:hypothetical protein
MFEKQQLRKLKEGDIVTFEDSEGRRDRGKIIKVVDEGRFYNIKSISKSSHIQNHWFIPGTNIARI